MASVVEVQLRLDTKQWEAACKSLARATADLEARMIQLQRSADSAAGTLRELAALRPPGEAS